MKLEHFGMAEPGDCRVVFSAAAEELEAAVQAEKAAPDAPQDEDDLLTAAVNRAILEGFSPLFAQLMKENDLQPVTDPDFELLAVNRAEGFRAGVQFFCLPPLELGEYTGFTQPIQPRPIRELTIELEINRRHGDEEDGRYRHIAHTCGKADGHGQEDGPDLTGRAGNGAEPHQTEGSRHRHTGADVAVDQQDHHLHHRRQDGQRHRKASAAPLAVHTHQRRQQAQNQRSRRTNEEGRKGQARSEDRIKH